MSGDANVILVGDYNCEYPRERELKNVFRANGAMIYECRFWGEPLFIGPKKLLLLPYLYLHISYKFFRLVRLVDVDVFVLTKFNPTMIPVVWLWARILGAQLVYDLFVSLDRTAELHGANIIFARGIYYLERFVLKLPDCHLTETDQFASLYADRYGLNRTSIIALPVGVDESLFKPANIPECETFTILYWGNFLPHHGLDTIVAAATALDEEEVEFVLLGTGPEQTRVWNDVRSRNLSNVRFMGRVQMDELVKWIASAQVCLGIFSSDVRAEASITNKVSEGVAMGRCVVTMDSPAVRDWFTDREDIYLIPPEDGAALAEAIRDLRKHDETRRKIARNARRRYEEVFSSKALGEILGERIPLSGYSD